jgi:predicted component of type VI protein secretion system
VEGFSPAVAQELETEVNRVMAEDHALEAFVLPQAEFAARPELARTLELQPPVNGRVVCVAAIYRTENQGKINKRLHVQRLEAGYQGKVAGVSKRLARKMGRTRPLTSGTS